MFCPHGAENLKFNVGGEDHDLRGCFQISLWAPRDPMLTSNAPMFPPRMKYLKDQRRLKV